MNKKISIELAVGIIILIALAFGGYVVFEAKKAEAPVAINQNANQAKAECEKKFNKECNLTQENGWQPINPNNLPEGNNKNTEIANPVSNLKTYRNEKYGFEFQYPLQFGEIKSQGKENYLIDSLEFSSFNMEYDSFNFNVFTDKSVQDWNVEIAAENAPIAKLDYPLSVRKLLSSKQVGYDCLGDFKYLEKIKNESCEIINVNGENAFKVIQTGRSMGGWQYAEVLYVFYKNNYWVEISRTFSSYYNLGDKINIAAMLQGKIDEPTVKNGLDIFNKIVATFKFAN